MGDFANSGCSGATAWEVSADPPELWVILAGAYIAPLRPCCATPRCSALGPLWESVTSPGTSAACGVVLMCRDTDKVSEWAPLVRVWGCQRA